MIEAKLNSNKGETLLTIQVPQTLYEVPLNRYVDFIVERGKQSADGKNMVSCASKAVSAFYAIDLDAVLAAQYSEGEKEATEAHVMAVKQLYGYASSLIDKHLGEQQVKPRINMDVQDFNFCGEKYNIPAIAVRALANGALETIQPPLSVIECIEGAEVQRVAEALIVDEGDPDGNFIFAKLLKLVAVFSRIGKETLPVDDSERERFIVSRADYFGGNNPENKVIDTGTALDIDFFLTPFSVRYKNIPIVVGFLYLQSLATVMEARLKAWPHKQGQKAKQKRTGRKSLSGLVGADLLRPYSKRATLRKAAREKQN